MEQAVMEIETRVRPLGKLLADSFHAALEGIGTYAQIVVIGLVPGYVVLGMAFGLVGFSGDAETFYRQAAEAGRWGDLMLLGGAGLVALCFRGLAFIALGLCVIAHLRNEALGVADSFGRAIDYIVPLLAAETRVFLWVLGGLFLLVVPGIVLAVRYCLVHWSVMVEHLTGQDALARSRQLVVAHMGKVIGNLLAAGFVVFVAAFAAAFVATLPLAMTGLMSAQPQGVGEMLLADFFVNSVKGVVGVWGVVFSAMLYGDLASEHPASMEGAEGVASPS